MMIMLSDLPEELLCQIAEHLSAKDMFNLAMSSSEMLQRMRSNKQLWHRRCEQEWFGLERAYEDCVRDIIGIQLGCSVPSDDYMEIFARRKRAERVFKEEVDNMVQLGFGKLYWGIFYRHTLNYGLVPFLVKSDSQYPVKKLDPRDKIGSAMLTTLRHNLLFKAMEKYSCSDEHLVSFERQLLLPLSAMDSSFFSLIRYRTSFYHKCHVLLGQRMKNLDRIKSVSPTLVVKQAIEVLMQVMSVTMLPKRLFREGDELSQGNGRNRAAFVDEFLLSRVYCGEADPNELIIICILQEFARQLDIHITIANGAMVIPDTLSPEGVTYLILRKKTYCQFEYQFLTESTFQDLLNEMNSVQGMTSAVDFEVATTHMSAKEIYTEFFIYLSEAEGGTLERMNELSHDMELLALVFPVAKMGTDLLELSVVGTFRKLIQLHEISELEQRSFNTMKRKMARAMVYWYPNDLAIQLNILSTESAKELFLSMSLRDYISQAYSIEPTRSSITGKFIAMEGTQYPALILNHQLTGSQDSLTVLGRDGLKYTVLVAINEVRFLECHTDDGWYHEFLTLNKRNRIDYFFQEKISDDGCVTLEPNKSLYC